MVSFVKKCDGVSDAATAAAAAAAGTGGKEKRK